MLLNYYHSSLVGGHAGVTKCNMTIHQIFYCPNLAHHIRAYIMGCHICQMFGEGKKPNINTPALSKISMDIKYMPYSTKQYKYTLVYLCEVTNFLIALPLKTVQTVDVCSAIINECIRYFAFPTHIIC